MATTQSWLEEAATSVLQTTSTIKEYGLYKDAAGVAQVILYFDAGTKEDPKHDYFIFRDGERVEVPSVTTILHTAMDKSMALVPWATKLATETIRERIFNVDGSMNQLSTEEWNALLEEAKKKHKEKLNDASNVGKIVHDALEVTIKEAIEKTDGYIRSARHTPGLPEFYAPGSDPVVELRLSLARNGFMAALDWCRVHNVQFLATEKKIFSRTYFYTGTADGNAHVTLCGGPCCRGIAGPRVAATVDWKTANELRIENVVQAALYQFAEIEETGLELTHRVINRLGKEDAKFSSWMCGPDTFEEDLNTGLDCLRLYNSKIKLDARWSAEKKAVREVAKAEKDKAKAAKLEAENLEKATRRKAKEELRLTKLAEQDALKAIRKADREEARLAKQAAKPVAGPALVKAEHEELFNDNGTKHLLEVVKMSNPEDDGPEPGIAHTVQAVGVARFWSVSSTTTGRIQ